MRVVIAGQMPPPVGGQNLNIKRLYEMLLDDDELIVDHWKFDFTKEVSNFRKFNFGKVWSLFYVIGRLFRLRAQGPIDVIIYPSGGPHTIPIIRDILILPFATALSNRVWCHFHAGAISERISSLPRWMSWGIKLVHKGCRGGIVLTRFGMADAEALNLREVEVIPIGVEDRASESVREKENDIKTILYVGHLREDKGTDILIRAFAKVYKEYSRYRLRLVGECSSEKLAASIHDVINETGCSQAIELVGLLEGPELDRVYEEADLFVFPSYAPSESYGMVLVEAMMHGLPVVAADWRAAREVLGSGQGSICYSIGSNHQTSLENALNEALSQSSSWPAWGCINRDIYKKHYTLEIYREQIKALITRS